MARSRYADDRDDDYEDRPPPASEGGGGTAVKIIAIVGAVVVVLALICGGAVAVIAYSFYSAAHKFADKAQQMVDQAQQQQASQDEGKRAADGFLRDIRQGRLDSAYQSTSAAYQKRVSRKDFDAYVAAHAVLKTQPQGGLMPHNFNPFANAASRYEFEYTTAEPGKLVTVIVGVVKEGDQWKLDELEAD